MVAGLEQNTSGRISIDNEVVSDAARGIFVPSERRRLGMVFQSYAIWPHMTVFENVAYPLRVRRRPAAEISELVFEDAASGRNGGICRASGAGAVRAASSSASRSRVRWCSSRRFFCSMNP